MRKIALALLAVVFLAALIPEVWVPASYRTQFRDSPNASPSPRFPLGTDDLGRDRLSRLVYGTRVSLLLAVAAAFLATMIAAIAGAAAAWLGGWWDRMFLAATDLSLALPWLFLLLTVRAMLPLDVAPATSILVTFTLLGLVGSAGPARVVRAGARALRSADFALQSRAAGVTGIRLLVVHLLPNLKPVLVSQFLLSIPLFILSEANLGLLGLGVAEPMPSWGNLLRDLESYSAVAANPWMVAPAILLVMVVIALQVAVRTQELNA
jgi:peptide/nickel transport system permease protein